MKIWTSSSLYRHANLSGMSLHLPSQEGLWIKWLRTVLPLTQWESDTRTSICLSTSTYIYISKSKTFSLKQILKTQPFRTLAEVHPEYIVLCIYFISSKSPCDLQEKSFTLVCYIKPCSLYQSTQRWWFTSGACPAQSQQPRQALQGQSRARRAGSEPSRLAWQGENGANRQATPHSCFCVAHWGSECTIDSIALKQICSPCVCKTDISFNSNL